MRRGSHTPWGSAQTVVELGDGIWMMTTASHGGIHVRGAAMKAIPTSVRETFINGPEWAEEDCEASIAIAILQARGLIDADRLGCGPDTIRQAARSTAKNYPRYTPALEHLPAAAGNAGATA